MRSRTRLTELFPRWLHQSFPTYDYGTPPRPASRFSGSRIAAQAAAYQAWESEGGSVKTPRS